MPRRADARLIELVAQFRRCRERIDALDRLQDRLDYRSPEVAAANHKIAALVERCWRIREAVTELPAWSSEGTAAKAWLAVWELCDGSPDEGPTYGNGAVGWSLARDLIGRTG